jgi:NitT/TauT family transport system substrate-binding protein
MVTRLSRIASLSLVAVFLVLLAAACAPVPAAAPSTAAAPSAATVASATAPAQAVGAGDTKLKLALIPVLDTIPIYIALQNGYFQAQGIQVETVPVKSPQERDVLLQTGQVDGVLTDLQGVGLLNKDAPKVKAVYTSRRPFPDAPLFRILASPKANISKPADLKGVPIGISKNTIIEYLTDRILAAEGLSAGDINKLDAGAITVRFEQLMNGNLQAAVLPDPLAQGAIAGGAKLIADDTKYQDLSQSVLVFQDSTLNSKPETVRKFLTAWEQAVKEVNTSPDKYRAVLMDQGRVPQSIQDSYKMPPFPGRGVPSESEVADVVAWLNSKGLISRDIPYTDMVDPSYLPK